MASNTVNISTTAVKMSNLRQSLNNFGDPISLGSARGQASSLPATGSAISLSANCKNYINVYNPLISLDANNYQFVAPTTWSDNSGNANNFTISSSAYSNVGGVAYMNFANSTAVSATNANIPLTYANGATILAFSKLNNVATNPRTLIAGISTGDKLVTINSATNSIGIFDNVNASGFNAMTNPGIFDISTIPSYSNTFNMLAIKMQTSSPYYQIKYNAQTSSNYYTNNSSVNAALKSGIGYIGGNNNTENWGQVGLMLVYNSILPDTQITDIYNRFAPRFYYYYPPVATNLIGYYTGDSWTGTQWSDLSGSGNHAVTTTGTIRVYNNIRYDNSSVAYQALNGHNYLAGGTTAGITFPAAILPQTYTLLWVARYAGLNQTTLSGAGTNQRIFDATTSDWLSGFSGGLAGVAKHGTNWVTQNSTNPYGNNWIIGSDQTNVFRANSSNLCIASGVAGTYNLTVNNGFNKATQASDWMVATVLVYSRELTTVELNTMELWLAQKYNLTAVLKLHTLDQINAKVSCVGAFSLVKLNAGYNGPIIKVRNGTNNSVMDFYSDINGNLTIAPDGTGLTLATWLGAATGYIDTWYDQSGTGNHAVQNALYDGTAYQPTIDVVNRIVSFRANSGVSRLKLPNGTIPSGDGSYSVILKHNTQTGTGFLGSGATNTTNGNNSFGISGTNYNNYWWGNDATTSAGNLVATGNVVTFKYTTAAYNNRVAFVNGTTQSVSFTGSTTVRNSTSVNNYIGIGDLQNNNYLNGELYYIYIFNTNISYSDQNKLEQTGFYIAPLSGLAAASITTTSMSLSWTQTNGYQYTQVSWNAGANTATVNYGNTTFSNFTAGNALLPNVSYTFTLTPYYYMNVSGNSATAASGIAYSTAATSVTAVTLPTVSGVSITATTANSMTVGWSAAGGTPTYNTVVVSWSPSTTGSPATAITAASGTITYTSPTNLAFNTQYTFTVTPYNSVSVAGTGVSAAATYTLAGSLVGQTISATISNSIATITWTDTNTPAATNYTVSWSSGSATTSSKTYTTGTLSAGTYTFTVTPNNASGVGNSGGAITSNPVTISAVVTQLTASPTPSVTDMNNTVLLMNFNGAHNSTLFTDSSFNNQQFNVFGQAILSSLIPAKFGLTAGYFPGGSYIQSSTNILNNLGNANFTIEFWLYWNGVNKNPGFPQIIISNNNSSVLTPGYSGASTSLSANTWSIGLTSYSNNANTKIGFTYYNQIPSVTIASVSVVPQNQWTHYAFARNGSSISVYVNGILETVGYIPVLGYIDDSITSRALFIGCGFAKQYLYGALNDLRIITNTVKYTANFTPPDDTTYDAYDYNTILLLHGNGVNNGITITDSSVFGTTFTNTGSPQVITSTAQSKFAGSALYFSGGTTTVLKSSTGSLYTFGASDFTIECWAYFTALSGGRLFGNGQGSYVAGVWQINIRANTNFEFATYNGVCDVYYTGTTIVTNTWYHLAVCRSGNTIYVWVNGQGTSGAISGSIDSVYAPNNLLCIGGDNFGDPNMSGYLAEIRVTKGLARYTAPFQVPTMPFKPYLNGIQDDPVVLLLHGDGANGSSTIIDSSYYATQFGTPQGTPQNSTTQFKFGTASISLSSASIRTPISSLYSFGTNDFTLEFWSYASTYNAIRFAGNINGTWAANNWYFGTNPSSQLFFGTFNLTPNPILTSTVTPPINTWNHIALVRNGTLFMIFLNGILVASNTVSGTIDNNAAVRLSIGDAGENGAYFNGFIDEFCITRGIAKYTGNFTPDIAPFLTNQPYDYSNAATILLLHGEDLHNSTGIIDSSYYQQQITSTNSRAKISNTYSPFGNSSIYFDGSSELVTPASGLNIFGTGDFTIEYWLYYSTKQYCKLISNILSYGNQTYGAGKWSTGIAYKNDAGNNNSASAIVFSAYSLGGNAAWQTPDNTLVLNQWQHIAVCKYNTTIYIYINGKNVLTNNNATGNLDNGNTSAIISIGTDRGDPYFTGYLDGIRITRGIARYLKNFNPSYNFFQPYGVPLTVPITLLLHFDGVNGSTVFIDSSPINASITTSGTAPILTTATTSPVSSCCISFAGSNNTFVATPSNLYYALGTGNFTIEFWFNATTISATSFLLFNRAYGTTYAANMWRIGFNSTANLQFSIWNISSNANVFLTTNTIFSTATWYHFALIRNNNTFMIYINGQLDISGVTSASMDGATASLICIGSIAASNSFTGFIDEFFFSNGYCKYISNFTLPTTPIMNMVNSDDVPANATVLLLHGDGANGGTTFTDSSIYQNSITGSGTTTSTAQIRFGTASLLFNNTGNLATPSSTIFSLNNNDFTIEFWIYFSTVPTAQVAIMGNLPGSYTTNSWIILYYLSGTKIAFLTNNQGSVYAQSSSTPVANRWIHYAFVRNGNSLIVYQDGVGVFYPTYFASAPLIDALSTAYTVYIGGGGGTDTRMSGYLDEVRITKGYAVYTGNFIPPTAPFAPKPVADVLGTPNVILLLHAEGTNGTISSTNPVIDSSYYNNTVSLLSSATPSYNTTTYKIGTSSFYFNGYANNVQNALRTSALPGFDTGDFTIEFWINISSFASQMRYFGNVSPTFYYEIGHGPGGQPFLNSSLGLLLLSGVSANTWTHLAFVRYNNRLYGYVNGILNNSIAFSGSFDNNASYTIDIGGCGYNSGQPNATFTGYMDEIRITKGYAQYTSNFTPSTMPFANPQQQGSAVTLLMHCEGQNGTVNLIDSSPYQNILTSYNYAQISTTKSVYGGSSLYLPDNNNAYVQTASSTYNNLGNGDFTIEFWFNWSGTYPTIGGQRIFSNATSAWAANIWTIGWDNDNKYLSAKLGFIANNINTFYVTKTSPLANTWYHFAVCRQGTSFYIFLNGILENTYTSSTAIDDSSTSRGLVIGGFVADSRYFYGYMDEIRVTKGIARYTASFSLPTKSYMTYTTPLTQQVTLGQIYPLDGLSNIAIKNAKALYAVVRLLSSYTGAIINVRRGLDSATLDFYSDAAGNLVSNLNGNGISLGAWLLGSAGYITKWYDQTGNGNDATQTTAASQPIINPIYKYVDFKTQANSFFNLPSGTVPQQKYYSVILRHNTTGNGNTAVGSLLGVGANTANQGNYFYTNASGVYTNSWISNDFSSYAKYTPGAVCSWVFGTQGAIGSTSSGVTSFYMNGTLASSPINRTSWAGVSGNETIGTNTPTANAALNGELYFVTLFNIALTDADRNIVESISSNSQAGLPSSATSLIANYDLTNSLSYTGNQSPCCLDGLSYAALLSAKGLYACVRLLTQWTGPVMNVRRGSNNVLMDFYADANGNLGTGFNATGVSLESWLAGNIGFVTIWYDQSGLGNHATQTATGSQPAVDINGRLLNFYIATNTVRFALPDGTFPSGDGSYTIILRHGKFFQLNGAGAGNIGLFGSGTPSVNTTLCSLVTAITGNSGAYRLYHYGNDLDSTIATINEGRVVSYTYLTGAGTNSRKIYLDGTLNAQNTPTAVRNSGTANNFIGYSESSNNNYLNGQLYYFTIFASVLSTIDRNIVENIGKFAASTIVNDLSGNKNNLTLTYAPSITNSIGGQSVNSYVNINTSASSQNTSVIDLSNGFTMETLVATKNTNTPTYNLNNGTGVSASVGAGAATVFGVQTPMEYPPTNLLTNMVTYLPLISNATDYGSTPQTVTTNGSVSYPSVGGYNGLYINNNNANYLSFPYTFPYTFTLCFWIYVIDTTYYTMVSITTTGGLSANLCLQVDTATSTNVTVFTAMPNQWTNQPTAAYGGISGWRFIAVTVNLNTYYEELYIGSATTATATATGTGNGFSSRSPNLIMLGRSGETGGRSYNGYIRQFALFNRVLTGSEINAYYNATLNNTIITASQIFGNSLYGNGRYITSASAYQQSYCSDLAFNKVADTFGWQSTAGVYAATSGVYNTTTYTTTASGQTFFGEWLQLKMPTCVYVTSYSLTCSTGGTTQFPYSWILVGSNDGSTWILLDNRNTQVAVSGRTFTYTIPVSMPLIYYRLIVTGIQLGNGSTSAALITEMKYFGDVVIPNYVTTSLLAYYDFSIPSSYIGAGTSLNDLSGNGLNMTISNGGTYSMYPYSMTTATNTGFTVGYTTGFANAFTVELVVNLTAVGTAQYLFQTGQVNTAGIISILNNNTQLQCYVGANLAYCTNPIQAGVWAHLVFSVSQVSNSMIYYNGIAQTMTANPSLSSVFPLTAGTSMFIGNGTNAGFAGSIAMCRVYTYAFTANDAMQNYMNVVGTTNRYGLTTNNYVSDAQLVYPPASLASATQISGSGSFTNNLYANFPVYSFFVSNQTYGNGMYYISASSQYNVNTNNQVWYAFNKVSSTVNSDQWSCATAVYNTSTGAYNSSVYTIANGNTYLGEWIQIQLPNPINLVSYSLYYASGVPNRMMNTWYVVGSNDGNTWYYIEARSNITGWSGSGITFRLNTVSNSYSYFRFIINKIQTSSDGYISICELVLNSINGLPSGTEIQMSSQAQIEYPPLPLTGYTTNITTAGYLNGTYVISRSIDRAGNEAWRIFDKNAQSSGWCTPDGTYYQTNANGVCSYIKSPATTTTYNGGLSVSGEWLQIRLPSQIILASYQIASLTSDGRENPNSFLLLASNDGSTWTLIDNRTSVGWVLSGGYQVRRFNLNINQAYIFYRIVITSLGAGSNGGFATMGEWRLFSNSISNYLTVINNNNATNISNQYADIVSEYPPAAMTANSTTLASLNYGNGTYIASASTSYPGGVNNPYLAFNKANSATVWNTDSSIEYYNAGGAYNGTYSTTVVSGITYAGAWLQINLPYPLTLNYYVITSMNLNNANAIARAPYTWILAGSNNGTQWTTVDTRSAQTYTFNQSQTYYVSISSQSSYTYYRLVITNVQTSAGATSLGAVGQWQLYGAPSINNSFMINTTNSLNPTGPITPVVLEYPPSAMSAYTTTIVNNAYGNGTYVANASSYDNSVTDAAWCAFNKATGQAFTSNIWGANGPYYNTASTPSPYTGTSTTIISQIGSVGGEWLEITLPYSIVLSSYSLQSRSEGYVNQMPVNWYIIGSNDNGTSWYIVDNKTTINTYWTALSQIKIFTSSNNLAYSKYRIVITTLGGATSSVGVSGGGGYASIPEWRLYGYLSTSPVNYIPPNIIPVNNWTHGVLTVSKTGAWSWYLNGILNSTGSGFIIPTNISSYLAIGDYAGIDSLCGSIALSRFYNRPLTFAQVANSFANVAKNYTLQTKVIDVSGNNQISVAGVPTIPNASFESPPITIGTSSQGVGTINEWNTTSNAGITTTGATFGVTNIPDGNQVLLLQSNNAVSIASTSVYNLTPGTSYIINFYLGMRSANINRLTYFSIKLGSTIIFNMNKFDSQFAVTGTTNFYTNPGFIYYSTNPFTATAGTATLTITFFAAADTTFYVDNMSITQSYNPISLATINTPTIPNPSFEVFIPNSLAANSIGYLSLPDSNGITTNNVYYMPGWIVPGTGAGTVIITNSGSSFSPPTMIDGNVCIGIKLDSTSTAPRIRTIITGLTPGQNYVVSFYVAYRTATNQSNLIVTVDGYQVYNNSAITFTTFTRQTCSPFWAQAPTAVLEFAVTTFVSGTDSTNFIDLVTISPNTAQNTLSGPVIPNPSFEYINPMYSGTNDPYFSNVVTLLHFNNNVTDSSQYAATITNNSATFNNVTYKFGAYSVNFNGSTGYLQTPSSTNYSFGTAPVTIEFWYYGTTLNWAMIGNSQTNSGTWAVGGYQINVNSSGQFLFNWRSTGDLPGALIYTTSTISANTWYHLAIVRNGASMTLFVNGVGQTFTTNITTSTSLDFAGANILTIGWNGIGADGKSACYIDDLRITKGVARYTTNFAVPTAAFPDYAINYSTTVSTTIATPNTVIPYWNTTNNVGIMTGASYFGTNSLVLSQTSANIATNPAMAITTIYGLVPGQSYVLQLYIFVLQSGSSAANLKININNVNIYTGTGITYSSFTLINTNAWTATGTIATLQLINDYNGNTSMCIIDTIKVISQTTINNTIIQYLPPEQNLIQFGSGAVAYGGYKYGPVYIDGVYYYVHKFTATGTSYFTVNGGCLNCDILVVAGGGGGGYDRAGGAGGGGVQYFTNQILNTGSYTVTVGAGGTGSTTSTPLSGNGTSGSNSQFGTLPASIGGGTGGQYSNGGAGGSGGGGMNNAANVAGGAGTFGQGFAGGSSSENATRFNAGGGGGAGAVGGNATSNIGGGNGGIGVLNNITGTQVYYGGGGGGSRAFDSGTSGVSGVGGLGGGGDAGKVAGANGYAGLPNTGGGGGGGANINQGNGGNGGSGIVIVRYPVSGSYIPPTLGDPYYNNVVLLMHVDNNLIDSSQYAATITNNLATFNNVTYKFGAYSVNFNGSTGYLQTPSSTNYSFGTAPVTIEFWYYGTTLNWGMIGNTQTNSGIWAVGSYQIKVSSSGEFIFIWYGPSALPGALIYTTSTLSANTWYHLAVVRNGASMTLFVNGVGQTFTTNITTSTSLDYAGANTLTIGWSGIGSDGKSACYIDDLRITKGIARYTSNFTVPQFAYPNNLGNQVLEYPPAALSGTGLTNTTTLTGLAYGNGVYVASASSGADTTNCPPSTCFNKTVPDGDQWLTGANTYNTTSGTYAGSTSTNGILGEWLQIQLPNMIILTSYSILSFYTSSGGQWYLKTPYTWTILGSNNGSLWTTIDVQYAQTYNAYNQSFTFNVSTKLPFSYYRMVIQRTQTSNPQTFAEVGEWRLFGY